MTGDENILLVVVSDTHINSTVSLCPLVVNLDDGGTYHASRTQHWLWDCWLHFWRYAKEKANGRRVIGIINGDLGELDTKRRSNQLISVNKATILSMATETLMPTMDIVDSWVFIRGTPAHEGKGAWLEEDIAKDTSSATRYSESIASWWHLVGKVSGIRVDIAHHASLGGRPYTKPTGAIRLASDTMWHYNVEKKQPVPNIVIRSHNHAFAESGTNFETRAFFTPCWSMMTEFVYRMGHENDRPSIGGLLFECSGEKYDWEYQSYSPREEKRVWKLSL